MSEEYGGLTGLVQTSPLIVVLELISKFGHVCLGYQSQTQLHGFLVIELAEHLVELSLQLSVFFHSLVSGRVVRVGYRPVAGVSTRVGGDEQGDEEAAEWWPSHRQIKNQKGEVSGIILIQIIVR